MAVCTAVRSELCSRPLFGLAADRKKKGCIGIPLHPFLFAFPVAGGLSWPVFQMVNYAVASLKYFPVGKILEAGPDEDGGAHEGLGSDALCLDAV